MNTLKTCYSLLSAVVLLGITGLRANAHLEVEVGVEIGAPADFYEPLGSYGTWVEIGSYGRCWRPARVEADWRPYCNGNWVATDAGWYWRSDEPWGWACYHYGRWAYEREYGWVWVPGIEWAPAWVSWREGGGYIGWAPLPPRVGFHGEVILANQIDIEPAHFVYIGTGHFLEPVRPRTVIVNNTTIVNKTVNITKIRQENKNITNVGSRKIVVNEGPRADLIEKATAKTVRAEPINEVARQAVPPAAVKEHASKRELKRESQPQEINVPEPKREVPPPAPKRELPVREPPRVVPQQERPDDSADKKVKHEKPTGESPPDKEHPDVPPHQPPPAQIKRAPVEPPSEDSDGKKRGKKQRGEEDGVQGEEQQGHGRGKD